MLAFFGRTNYDVLHFVRYIVYGIIGGYGFSSFFVIVGVILGVLQADKDEASDVDVFYGSKEIPLYLFGEF